MGIGFSIFLLALGAILAFAVNATVAGLDISIVGWILMGAGVIGLILTMVVLVPRRRRTVTESQTVGAVPAADPARPDTRIVVDETVTGEVR
jgi:hypothetical protein